MEPKRYTVHPGCNCEPAMNIDKTVQYFRDDDPAVIEALRAKETLDSIKVKLVGLKLKSPLTSKDIGKVNDVLLLAIEEAMKGVKG